MYELDYPVIGEASKFAFANACLALMENKLLSQSQLDQFRVADSFREFNRMLSETIYGTYLEKGSTIGEIVEEEIIRTREELYEILPEEVHPFFDVFYRKYDYNNLKMLLKSHFLNKEPDPSSLSRAGVIDSAELSGLITSGTFEEMPIPFDYGLMESAMKAKGELWIIDGILDRAYYREYLEQAEKLKDTFFLDFVRQQIDLKNILIFIRCHKTGLPLESFLLDGGYVDLDVYQNLAGESLEGIMLENEFNPYRSVISEGMSTLEKTGSYAELETSIRNYFISILKEVRNVFFTVKPFIGYLLAKEHETGLIKKFYVHISNNMEFGQERDLSYA